MIDVRFASLITWPRPSTPADKRGSRWSFRAGWPDTLALLEGELSKLKADDIVIECGLLPGDIRNDGWPRANARQPEHPGVILSFTSRHGALRYLTDRYDFWQHNVRAIALGLQALRAVDRYAITSDGEQYRGWAAIEQTSGTTFDAQATILRVIGDAAVEGIDPKAAYRQALKVAHPDRGGSRELLEQVMEAGRRLGVAR